jgi:Fe-S-cluster containining protein
MNFKQKFFDITELIQQEFDRNSEKYGDKLKCRKGCSQCCSQIFRITLLDAHMIKEHIKSLPLESQTVLKSKAEEYLKHKNKPLPLNKGEYPKEVNSQINAEGVTNHLPCPALGGEGECTIYEARPVICRRFGIPIYDYKNPGKIHACELNFKQGEEILDDELVPNQTAIGMKWDELKEEYLKHLPLDKPVPHPDAGGEWSKTEGVNNEQKKSYTTIAEAIAETRGYNPLS